MARIVSEDELREVLEPFGGPDAMLESMQRFKANREYLEGNRERLKQRYPDQWVAIVRRQVVAHGNTQDDVLRALREAGEDLDGTLLRYLTTEDRTWLL